MQDNNRKSVTKQPKVAPPDAKAHGATSPELKMALAERRREMSIMRYHLSVRRGVAWSKRPRTYPRRLSPSD